MNGWSGFSVGLVGGVLLGAVALLLVGDDGALWPRIEDWMTLNLGGARWLFLATLVLFAIHLAQLRVAVQHSGTLTRVAQLDQLVDVWIHMFVGIGVVWTAIGMRSALQSALADPTAALHDSAGNVLRALVDGGILLALTTTIVGGIGGYLMKLGKAIAVGAALHNYYAGQQQSELRELLVSVRRIETLLGAESLMTCDEATVASKAAPLPAEPATAAGPGMGSQLVVR